MPSAAILSSAGTFRQETAVKVAFIMLNQLDLALTTLAMSLGFHEINPLMRQMLTMPLLLATAKIAVPVLIAWLSPGKLLWPAVALLLAVSIWNLKEMLVFLF